MANLRIAEMLHDAKVFVLFVADEVTFKARQLMEVDQQLPRGGTPAPEAFEDELPTLVRTQSPLDGEDWDDLVPMVDRTRQTDVEELKSDVSLDEELFASAEGASDVPNADAVEEFDDLEEEDLDLPSLRPSHENLVTRVPRSMLMQGSGGFAEDERMDR